MKKINQTRFATRASLILLTVIIGVFMFSHETFAADPTYGTQIYPTWVNTTFTISSTDISTICTGNSNAGGHIVDENLSPAGSGFPFVGTGFAVCNNISPQNINQANSATAPSGTYYIGLQGNNTSLPCTINSTCTHWFKFIWTGTTVVLPPDTAETRYINFFPPYVAATTTATTTGFNYYINSDEWNTDWRIQYVLSKYGNDGSITQIQYQAPTSTALGNLTYSTTSPLLTTGKYLQVAKILKPRGFIGSIFIGGYIEIASSTIFWVGATSSPRSEGINDFQARLEAQLASTTYKLGQDCNPLGDFNMGDCLVGIFYPGSEAIAEDLLLIKQMPPWGYIFRFYDIIASTTATSSLPIINATIPNGVVGTGATLTIDLAHSVDYILNATTSTFNNVSASSTKTLGEITMYYWNIICYIGLGLYILGRLTGIRIPLMHKKQ